MASASCSIGSCGKSRPASCSNDALNSAVTACQSSASSSASVCHAALALRARSITCSKGSSATPSTTCRTSGPAGDSVEGEARVAGELRQPLGDLVVQPDVEDGVHHPRHRELGPRAAGDQQRVRGIAELLAGAASRAARARRGSRPTARAGTAAARKVGVAGFGGDGEARRHRHTDARHVGQVRALAAEQGTSGLPGTAHSFLGQGQLVEPINPAFGIGSPVGGRRRRNRRRSRHGNVLPGGLGADRSALDSAHHEHRIGFPHGSRTLAFTALGVLGALVLLFGSSAAAAPKPVGEAFTISACATCSQERPAISLSPVGGVVAWHRFNGRGFDLSPARSIRRPLRRTSSTSRAPGRCGPRRPLDRVQRSELVDLGVAGFLPQRLVRRALLARFQQPGLSRRRRERCPHLEPGAVAASMTTPCCSPSRIFPSPQIPVRRAVDLVDSFSLDYPAPGHRRDPPRAGVPAPLPAPERQRGARVANPRSRRSAGPFVGVGRARRFDRSQPRPWWLRWPRCRAAPRGRLRQRRRLHRDLADHAATRQGRIGHRLPTLRQEGQARRTPVLATKKFAGDQTDPALVFDPTGSFVIAWKSIVWTGSERVFARRFARTARPSGRTSSSSSAPPLRSGAAGRRGVGERRPLRRGLGTGRRHPRTEIPAMSDSRPPSDLDAKLYAAAEAGRLDDVRELLDAGADANSFVLHDPDDPKSKLRCSTERRSPTRRRRRRSFGCSSNAAPSRTTASRSTTRRSSIGTTCSRRSSPEAPIRRAATRTGTTRRSTSWPATTTTIRTVSARPAECMAARARRGPQRHFLRKRGDTFASARRRGARERGPGALARSRRQARRSPSRRQNSVRARGAGRMGGQRGISRFARRPARGERRRSVHGSRAARRSRGGTGSALDRASSCATSFRATASGRERRFIGRPGTAGPPARERSSSSEPR